VEPETAGNPMSEQKWVRSSLRHLSEELNKVGHRACPKTVARLLKQADYSLKVNSKRLAGAQHPDRNTQFEHIAAQKKLFLSRNWPVISVDAKKKELIGNFRNAGQCWCQEPEVVNDHDFESEALCKSVPYGIYDVNRNCGYMYVSQSADTAQFAVDMIVRWWLAFGQYHYPNAPVLLILCDGGGSNGWRSRLWKLQVQEQLADRINLEVMVCHYPKNASKWNPIEHRLFSPISLNWRGKPLRTLETMLAYIRGTTTRTGLQVAAFQVNQVYERGIKVDDDMIQRLNIERHSTCPNWNYTIRPRVVSVCA
jgi:hypothetical protein